jgi:hypothetical protein
LHVGEGRFKTIEEYMDIEDDMLEENDELITYFDLFEMWVY